MSCPTKMRTRAGCSGTGWSSRRSPKRSSPSARWSAKTKPEHRMSSLARIEEAEFGQLFETWWSNIDDEDRYEFSYEHKGDTRLARFACALELLAARGEFSVSAAFQLATGCTTDSGAQERLWRLGTQAPRNSRAAHALAPSFAGDYLATSGTIQC